MADQDDKAAREERLRRALRDNLRRRKQAAQKDAPGRPGKPAGK